MDRTVRCPYLRKDCFQFFVVHEGFQIFGIECNRHINHPFQMHPPDNFLYFYEWIIFGDIAILPYFLSFCKLFFVKNVLFSNFK